jgi:hypothetical protein
MIDDIFDEDRLDKIRMLCDDCLEEIEEAKSFIQFAYDVKDTVEEIEAPEFVWDNVDDFLKDIESS